MPDTKLGTNSPPLVAALWAQCMLCRTLKELPFSPQGSRLTCLQWGKQTARWGQCATVGSRKGIGTFFNNIVLVPDIVL